MNASARPPLSESPWFWVYLFTTFAMIVLLVMGPRVMERQAQLERKEQGRRRAAERIAGQEPQTRLSTPESTQITLSPLFLILGAVWIVAWVMLWRRFRRPASPKNSSPDKPSSGEGPHPT